MTNVIFQSSLTGVVDEGFPTAVCALRAPFRVVAANCKLLFIHIHFVLFHCYEGFIDIC